MNDKKNKVIFTLVGLLIGAGLIFYLGSYVVPKVLVTLSSKASAQKVSTTNSLLIGSVIMANANGLDKCVINAFVLDSDGKGIQGRTVQLTGLGMFEAVTDSNGKAIFELTSTTAGQYQLSANVGGVALPKTVTVIFR